MDKQGTVLRSGFRWFFLVISMGFLSQSCSESKQLEDNYLGYDFYPLEVGRYSIYEVENIQYLISGYDTSRYFLKETIYDTLVNGSAIEYLIRKEIRSNVDDPWRMDSLASVSMLPSYLAFNEGNSRTIKLVFPVHAGKNWDANSLSSRSAENRYYEAVSDVEVDSLDISDHIKVVISNIEQNITGIDKRSEIYARGAGLVKRDFFTQVTCTASDCGDDLGEVISGRSYKQNLIEIGYND